MVLEATCCTVSVAWAMYSSTRLSLLMIMVVIVSAVQLVSSDSSSVIHLGRTLGVTVCNSSNRV